MTKKLDLNLEEIGKRLRLTRTALNLSIEKIGADTGFSKSLISEAENGRKKPSSIYLYGLLTLYKVNINYILTGDGGMFLEFPVREHEDKDLEELYRYMNKMKFIKYSMLSYFQQFKLNNHDIIEKFMETAPGTDKDD